MQKPDREAAWNLALHIIGASFACGRPGALYVLYRFIDWSSETAGYG